MIDSRSRNRRRRRKESKMRNERHHCGASWKVHAELSRRPFVLASLDHPSHLPDLFLLFLFFLSASKRPSSLFSLLIPFFFFPSSRSNDTATGGSILSRFVAVHLRMDLSVGRFQRKEVEARCLSLIRWPSAERVKLVIVFITKAGVAVFDRCHLVSRSFRS